MTTDIIFDFFGTLVDYTPGVFHTAPYQRTHQFLQQQGFTISYDTFIDTFTAASDELEAEAKQTLREYHMHDVGRNFFQRISAHNVDDRTLAAFIALFIAEWSRGIVYMDGIAPFIATLASQYRLSVLSNTHYPALIHDHLAAMEIHQYFSRIVTSVEIGIRKPHAAIFEQTLASLEITPQQAIYIGDTYEDDYQGATAANIRCVLIDPQGRFPQVLHRIEKLFDLNGYLQKL